MTFMSPSVFQHFVSHFHICPTFLCVLLSYLYYFPMWTLSYVSTFLYSMVSYFPMCPTFLLALLSYWSYVPKPYFPIDLIFLSPTKVHEEEGPFLSSPSSLPLCESQTACFKYLACFPFLVWFQMASSGKKSYNWFLVALNAKKDLFYIRKVWGVKIILNYAWFTKN
jgi:hypothetical protein